MSDDPGNEFWRIEDSAVRDEFATIFGSEVDPADDFTLDAEDEFGDPADMPTDSSSADWPDCEF